MAGLFSAPRFTLGRLDYVSLCVCVLRARSHQGSYVIYRGVQDIVWGSGGLSSCCGASETRVSKAEVSS